MTGLSAALFQPRKLLERACAVWELQNRQAVHTRVGGGVVHSALLIGSCDQVHAPGISYVAVSLRYTRSARGFSLLLGSRKSRAKLVWYGDVSPRSSSPFHRILVGVPFKGPSPRCAAGRTSPLTGIVLNGDRVSKKVNPVKNNSRENNELSCFYGR